MTGHRSAEGHFHPREQGPRYSHPGGQGRCRSPGPRAGHGTQVGTGMRVWADPGQAVRARSPLDPRASQAGVWSRPRQHVPGKTLSREMDIVGFTLFPGRQPGSCPPLAPWLGPLVIRSPFPDTVNFHLAFQNWILDINESQKLPRF